MSGSKLRVEAFGATHKGRRRDRNEDAFAVLAPRGVFMVADGLGGRPAGALASKLAVEQVGECFCHPEAMRSPGAHLTGGVLCANVRIFRAAKDDPNKLGMSTTFTGLAVGEGEQIDLAHVGDSRCYRYRQGQLDRLTEDHVFFNECLRWGVPAEVAAAHPHRALLTRALGLKHTVDVSTRREDVRRGDVVLLSTDGLHGVVTDREIAAILSDLGDLSTGVERLIARANDSGGPDNVTAILVRWS